MTSLTTLRVQTSEHGASPFWRAQAAVLIIRGPFSVNYHFNPVMFVLCLVGGVVATAGIIFLIKRKG
jgi:hypothetical protein